MYLDKVELARQTWERSSTRTPIRRGGSAQRPGRWASRIPQAKTPPDELYQPLKPFKDKLAEDIDETGGDDR